MDTINFIYLAFVCFVLFITCICLFACVVRQAEKIKSVDLIKYELQISNQDFRDVKNENVRLKSRLEQLTLKMRTAKHEEEIVEHFSNVAQSINKEAESVMNRIAQTATSLANSEKKKVEDEASSTLSVNKSRQRISGDALNKFINTPEVAAHV